MGLSSEGWLSPDVCYCNGKLADVVYNLPARDPLVLSYLSSTQSCHPTTLPYTLWKVALCWEVLTQTP